MTEPRKFGTFGGVFVPNVLTILGVILFMRTGWVVGSVGLWGALAILCLAKAITFLTSLSLSAVSTNTHVGAGGAYFLISRSLGLEVGGALGVPLYLAQAVSVAFYLIGFAESLELLLPYGVDPRATAAITLGVLLVIAWLGADLAIKTQYVILGLLVVSLASFFAGYDPLPGWRANTVPAVDLGQDFWHVFAIFFPAVTGIMAGVSMSGDLRDPARSIPRGTLWSVGLCAGVYGAQMLWLAMNAERADLLTDSLVMRRIAVVPALIFVGLWAATLSSALTSLVAAPRTLQALARDKVAPRFLGRGHGPAREPRIALVLTTGIALACVSVGKLDLIAPVISMFFLTAYGMVNLVAGLERLVSNPSYRPTFRVHWSLSLLGAIGCLVVMMLLNPAATVVAVAVIAAIYLILTRMRYQTAWGDMRSGLWFAVTRYGLLRFSASRQHVRNWRPVLLVLAGNPTGRRRMVQFANWIEARRGMLFLGQTFSGDWDRLLKLRKGLQEAMERFISENRLSAVAKTVIADDFEDGVTALLQVTGLGEFQPNTVLMGWSDDAVKEHVFESTVRKILQLRKNLLLYRATDLPLSAMGAHIDVWWLSRANFNFMLTVAHLIHSNARWSDHQIRVWRVIHDDAGRLDAKEGTAAALNEARIPAKVLVVTSTDPVEEVIARTSARSGLVFVGLPKVDSEDGLDLVERFSPMMQGLVGHVFLCTSWQELEL